MESPTRLDAPSPNSPLTVQGGYFYLKYNWNTHQMCFLVMDPVNSRTPDLYEQEHKLMMDHEEDETVHRCSIVLTRPAEVLTGAKDLLLETDHVAWQNITCQKIMNRVSVHRMIPVLPIVNKTGKLESMYIHIADTDKKAMRTIIFMNRTFRITVEELSIENYPELCSTCHGTGCGSDMLTNCEVCGGKG